jgi:hypothetical protein
MKRLLFLALLAAASVTAIHAQAVDVNVCDVVKKPQNFNGKTVRIKGVVFAGFDSFIVKDPTGECGFPVDAIWLDYPQGTKGKAGAAAVLHIQPAHNYAGPYQAPTRAAVTLDKSKDFKQFDSLLSQIHNKGAALCVYCVKNQVSATLVGRLDTVADASIKRDASGKVTDFGGFGSNNMYAARLVLQSVSDVSAKEQDYTASDAAVKGDVQPNPGNPDLFDPLEAAGKVVAGPLANTPAAAQAQKAIGAFPKRGEKNGVTIVTGGVNEVKDEGPGKVDSPDGVLYTVHFNQDRLQGPAYIRALFHMGEHIADLRSMTGQNDMAPPYVLEFNAWSMSISSGIVSGDKALTLPGGSVVWNVTWTADNRQSNMEAGVSSYLKAAAINR